MNTAAVHQRTLRVLWAASIFGRGAVSAIFAVAVLALTDLLGSETWAGMSTAANAVGGGVAAVLLARLMARSGRRPGLTVGFAVAALGAVLCIVSIHGESLFGFILGMGLIGVGSGTSRLSRYAAADLASDERRSRDIGSVIFASTFGAVLFPLLIGPADSVGENFGLQEHAGAFAMGAVLFAACALVTQIFMRPDPLKVAEDLVPRDSSQPRAKATSFAESLAMGWSIPQARLAILAMVVAQAVMVMVMAMTPVHMEAHGHETGIIGAVISAHTAGMFAFAPLAGRLSDRLGRQPTILAGAFTLVIATVLTALAGEAPALLMFPGLFFLGLGWSFGIVAGSALLTESLHEEHRVSVQGAADTLVNVASGVGALASGVVVSMAGFHILSMIGIVAAGALGARTLFETRLAALR